MVIVPRLFIVGAIVLIVLFIVAAASASGTALGVSALVWLGAALLSFFVDLLLTVVYRPPQV